MYPTTIPIAPMWQFPRRVRLLALLILSLCLVGFQVPPPDGTGSGMVLVQVVSTTSSPIRGLKVHYLDEWQRRAYGTCITNAQGECRLAIEHAPTLGVMLRGVLAVEGSTRLRDAMLMVNEQITVRVMIDAGGRVMVDADVLATRDPNATPTLIGVEAALATLTAAAQEPLATPSPGIEMTVAAAHAAMTATGVARASLTPTPRFTPTASATPNVGIAVIVNNTPLPVPEPSAPTEVPVPVFYPAGRLLAAVVIAGMLLTVCGAWWMRRDHGSTT